MLTGDKGETAKQIAFTCAILKRTTDFTVLEIDEHEPNIGKKLTEIELQAARMH